MSGPYRQKVLFKWFTAQALVVWPEKSHLPPQKTKDDTSIKPAATVALPPN